MVYLPPLNVPVTPVGKVPVKMAPVDVPPTLYTIFAIDVFIQVVELRLPELSVMLPSAVTVIVPLKLRFLQDEPVAVTV